MKRSAAPSALHFINDAIPDLTVGPILCRRFAPPSMIFCLRHKHANLIFQTGISMRHVD
jgi:hypothetical protein